MAARFASRGYSLKNKDGDQMINSLRLQAFLIAARRRYTPGIRWVPEDIFFLSMAKSRQRGAKRLGSLIEL